MSRKLFAYLLAVLFLLPLFFPARARDEKKSAQSQEDSVARLIHADTLQIVEIRNVSYRKVKGNAMFLHNNTYLICDSALWNVDAKVIDAMGNVKLKQERTVLTSDKLTYYVDRDLAEFRGGVVQLVDKDHNTLRTRYLDYNTKDSVAVFRNGGAMRDKDGQVIESRTGTYDSKLKSFTFNDDVNMFSDTLFVKTSYLRYDSDPNTATFGYNTNAWKEDNMLSANAGWYDRNRELFFFNRQVHVMSDSQEAWSDSLYFNRATNDVRMLGHAQVTDTTRNVFALAGVIDYVDSLGRTILTREPAIITETEEKNPDGEVVRDSLYFGADSIVYISIRMCDVDSVEIVDAKTRLESVNTDPVSAHRKQAAEAARKAAEEAAANDPNNPENAKKRSEEAAAAAAAAKEAAAALESPRTRNRGKNRENSADRTASADAPAGADTTASAVSDSTSAALPDSLAVPVPADSPAASPDSLSASVPAGSVTASPDSIAAPAPLDSLASALPDSLSASAAADSLALADSVAVKEPLDTTKVGFVHAYRNVRMFRKSMQMACDSLSYNDLDSLARLYETPVVWNEEGRHQYSADSIYAVVSNSRMEKANLLNNAFIHIQEDTLHYDQIKSTEMTAFFAEDNSLARFDALGGTTALFYLEENNTLATVNRKECKMMSAIFNDGEIQKIYYFETAKSDGYPVVQMTREDQRLKGFSWDAERRPKSRTDVTPLYLRPGERSRYSAVARPKFVQTDIYFPGYISDINRQIEVRDSLNRINAIRREEMKAERARMEEQARLDSLRIAEDSLRLAAVADSLAKVDSLARVDSLAAARDSVAALVSAAADTVSAASQPVIRELTAEEIAAKEKAEKAAAKEAKRAAKAADKARRQAELEAKWKAQDEKAAAREQAKKDRQAEKLRKKKEKALKARLRQEAVDQSRLDAYIEKYRKKLERKNRK